LSLLFIFIFILLGLFTGSFLNVCIDRLPQGQSIINPPSHCTECNQRLKVLDLIPVFSYIWLRGRCRYCQARIPLRLPIVEGITAFLFAFLYWNFGLGLELAILLIYSSILIVIFVIDLEHLLVLNKIVYPSMALALVFSFFRPEIAELTPFLPDLGIVSALVGGVLGLAIMALPFIIYRKGMGMGDVKLGALVGLMTGFPFVIIAIMLSWIIGGIVAGILLALKIKGRKDAIPAAIFLATTTVVTLIWGQAIWQWYLW
jgi:leader peptidase (prepilin peptidase)/N-methyltransferase